LPLEEGEEEEEEEEGRRRRKKKGGGGGETPLQSSGVRCTSIPTVSCAELS
jgi:hypothetical protein